MVEPSLLPFDAATHGSSSEAASHRAAPPVTRASNLTTHTTIVVFPAGLEGDLCADTTRVFANHIERPMELEMPQ